MTRDGTAKKMRTPLDEENALSIFLELQPIIRQHIYTPEGIINFATFIDFN